MSRLAPSLVAPGARVECPPATLALLERQALAWITGDFAPAAPDWHPEGELVAPGNRVPAADLPRAVAAFHRGFMDLRITVTAAFAAPSGRLVALEWLWEVSRREDGARSATPDAIVVELEDGLIRSWREYFDTAGAVEAHHAGAARG